MLTRFKDGNGKDVVISALDASQFAALDMCALNIWALVCGGLLEGGPSRYIVYTSDEMQLLDNVSCFKWDGKDLALQLRWREDWYLHAVVSEDVAENAAEDVILGRELGWIAMEGLRTEGLNRNLVLNILATRTTDRLLQAGIVPRYSLWQEGLHVVRFANPRLADKP